MQAKSHGPIGLMFFCTSNFIEQISGQISRHMCHQIKGKQKLNTNLLYICRHPEDIPLFLSSSVVKRCLTVIESGLQHHNSTIVILATEALSAMLR